MKFLFVSVAAEHKKMAHNHWWLLFFLIPVFPAIMGSVNYCMNLEILKNGWYDLWTQVTLFYATLFFAPMIAICCSYLWRLEHANHNWNSCLTVPVPVFCLYGAKLLEAGRLTLLLQLWIGVLYVMGGKLSGLSGMPPAEICLWLIRGSLGGLVVAAVQLLISMVIRSFSIPVVIAFTGSISGMLLSIKGLGIYWPYGLMMEAMNSNHSVDMLDGFKGIFVFMTVFYLVLMGALSVLLLAKRDVKTYG